MHEGYATKAGLIFMFRCTTDFFREKMLSSTWHKHLRERWKSTFSQVCTSCDLVISPCVIANDENYISSSGTANPVHLTLFMNMVNPFARQDDEA